MKKHILIINQHGENRGDEAALRAMLAEFEAKLEDVEFTLLYQFRSASLRLNFDQKVEDLPIVLPYMDYIRLLLYTVLKILRVDWEWILSPVLRSIIRAYKRTDLIVSAPGGPYFGDIYANHEILHWWFVLLGQLFKKPMFLYATSAGPFAIKSLNVVRRWLYPKFSTLVVREEVSASYIRGLLGKDVEVIVTADSAIQQDFAPYQRIKYFDENRSDLQSKMLIAVSLNDYSYPDSEDPRKKKDDYEREIIKVLSHLLSAYDAHLMMFPQLYGGAHSDYSFLENMGKLLPDGSSWEIIDPGLDSDMQRRLFAMCDVHLASRYHPAIFGNTGLVPGICIFYEHKAVGFMEQLGLGKYAFDIRNLDANTLNAALDEIILHRKEIVAHLKESVPLLRAKSRETTQLALNLIV